MGSENNPDIQVSIIIVSYNQFNLLDKCIDSLCYYNKEINFEIIVVDNASTEGNIYDVLSKFNQVKLTVIENNRNLGFSKANNQAIQIAKGRYILFLNNDTVFIEDSVRKVYSFAEIQIQPVIIGCKLLNADGSDQISVIDYDTLTNLFGERLFLYLLFRRSKLMNRYHLNYKNLNMPTEIDSIKGAFMFCTAKLIKKLNGFDERFFFYGEEIDLCRRVKSAGGKIIYFPGTKLIHHGSGAAKRSPWRWYKYQQIGRIKLLQKYYKGGKFIAAITLYYYGVINRILVYFLTGLILLDINRIKKSCYYFKLLFVYPKNEFRGKSN
ncbi:MAG: hypothetical protein Kow0098_11160 [Ignavibacteriaceae bacterium]